MAIPLPNALQRRSIPESYDYVSSMQNRLQQEQIANALKKNELNFAPQMSQAEIGLKKGQAFENYGRGTNYFAEAKTQPSRAALNYAMASESPYKNSLMSAQAGLAEQENKFIPTKYDIDRMKAQAMLNRYGGAQQLSNYLRSMPEASRAQWMQDNPEASNALVTNLANNALNYSGGNYGMQGMGGEQPGFNPPPGAMNQNALLQQAGMGQAVPPPQGAPPNAMAQPPGQMPPPAQQQQMQQQNPAAFQQATPEQVKKSQLVLQKDINDKLVTNQIKTRADSAIAMDGWLMKSREEYAPRINNAMQYAGTLGKGKKAIDALKSENPQAYTDYLWFKTTFSTNMSNHVKQMEKMGATDEQRKEMLNMWDRGVNGLDVDPQGAVRLLNQAIGTMMDTSNAVINAAEPAHKGVYRQMAGIPEMKGDYLSIPGQQAANDLSSMSTEDLMRIANGGQ